MEVPAVPNAMMDLRSGEADLVSALMAARGGTAAVAGRADPLSLDRAYAVQAQVFAETGDRQATSWPRPVPAAKRRWARMRH